MKKRPWYLLGLTLAALGAGAAEPFFKDGRTDWKIYLASNATPTEAYAAEELQAALRKISGADFAVVSNAPPAASRAIVIGDLNNPDVQARAAALKLSPGPVESLAVYTLDDRLYLAGNQPRGALYAVYSFLRRELGARWLWAGPSGEFMPVKAAWTLPQIAYNHTPSFAYRGAHLTGDRKGPGDAAQFLEWEARNFMNYYGHTATPAQKRMGFYSVLGGHGVNLPAALFKEHPEYFAEIGGRRSTAQICYSHPEALRLIVEQFAAQLRQMPYVDLFGPIPSDTPSCCRCAECAKMDPSTAWFEFRNRMTDALKKEFPHLKFRGFAYSFYRQPPKCVIRNCEFVMYATYDRCNVHPYGYPDCKDNETTLRNMQAWTAAGHPMGTYSYEHGVFRTTSLTTERQVRFAPFLTMFSDMIKTHRQLGHVAIIPERALIGFLPKYKTLVPTEDYVYQIQQRLTSYLYVRLMWDADQKMEDVLRDWCQTLFGPAAEPMEQYYLAMDRAWGAMPGHLRFLHAAAPSAPLLLAGDLPARSRGYFDTAEERLAPMADPAARERALAALRRERVFFKQWENLVTLQQKEDPRRVDLPLQSPANPFGQTYSRPQMLESGEGAGRNRGAQVQLAWSEDALRARWTCPCPKAAADTAKGERVELVLDDGVSGEKWHLVAQATGARQSWRELRGGRRDEAWNPAWDVKTVVGAEGWEARMTIPFASLGSAPIPTESWEAGFARHANGRIEQFPAGRTAHLFFHYVPRVGQTAMWWIGTTDKRDAWIKSEFGEIGYDLRLVEAVERLAENSAGCPAFWFEGPSETNNIPAEYWSETLLPAIRNGAVAVFALAPGKTPFALERCFDDPSFQMQCQPLKFGYRLLRSDRATVFIAPGGWSLMPNDLEKAQWPPLKLLMPDFGVDAVHPQPWTVLARMPLSPQETCPYLLVRPYEKGLVVVTAADLPLRRAKLLDNLVLYNSRRMAAP